MTLYRKFKQLNIDFAAIGLKADDEFTPYFCTPKGACVIGTAGVDGIHYCFVRGHGETVFAVNPSNPVGRNVHPIAWSFGDLLGLLLACGSMDALEQVHLWDEEQFEEYISSNPPTDGQREIFAVLREKLNIVPMEQPYEYLRELQDSYRGELRFSREYKELRRSTKPEMPSEWYVTLEDGFHPRRGKHGREVPVEKQFLWGHELWHIPSVYVFSGGMVVDFCAKLNGTRVKEFYDKYLHIEQQGLPLTEAEELKIRMENPTNIDFHANLIVNGEVLRAFHSHHQYWIPENIVGHNELENRYAKWVLEHYGFDLSDPWMLCRSCYTWEGRRQIALDTLSVEMKRDRTDIPGEIFVAPTVGESILLTHPITSREYTLTVREYEEQEMKEIDHEELEFPRHLAAMTYTIYPPIDPETFMLQDCDKGDDPRPKNPADRGRLGMSVGAIAVIRSSKDSDKCYEVNGERVKPGGVCSSLHFEPMHEPVRWQPVFREQLVEDLRVMLL